MKFLSVLVACLFCAASFAQAQQPVRLRGTIAVVSGSDLQITLRDGSNVSATLAPDFTVASAALAQIGDIKPDSYIGTAAVPQPDGTLVALEVHVFAPSMRGAGEGFRPWDSPGPANTMTNGTVGSVTGTTGRTLHVTYRGGEKDIVVPPDVPIVSLQPAGRDLVREGTKIVAFGSRAEDGKITVQRLTLGIGGSAPPM